MPPWVLMGIEIRLFLVIDALSRFSGMLLACSASLSLFASPNNVLIPLRLRLAAVLGP